MPTMTKDRASDCLSVSRAAEQESDLVEADARTDNVESDLAQLPMRLRRCREIVAFRQLSLDGRGCA